VKKVFVLVFLLSSSVMAGAPVTPSRDSLSARCYRMLNIPVTGTKQNPTTNMYDALNGGLAAVCRDFPALEKIDTLTIDREADGAALPTDFVRLKSVFRMKGDTLRLPLKIIDIDAIPLLTLPEKSATQDKGDITSPGFAYTYGGRLMTHPKYIIPSLADSFLVYYYAMDDKIDSASDTVFIAKEYLNALTYFACWQLSAVRGDFQGATYWRGLYDMDVNAARKSRAMEAQK